MNIAESLACPGPLVVGATGFGALACLEVVEAGGCEPLPGDLPAQVVARSPAMRRLLAEAAVVARADCRVLLSGESGAGKEVLADLIHGWSSRAERPFVKVNCAAIPEDLLESELFGHERGAFTGAVARRPGKFEAANGGTLLLDEIGELSPGLQAKLLRVTQDGVFQRVGSGTDIAVNVRLISATNRDLERRMAEKLFREDLYYRLNVIELRLPALRERAEDVLPLALHFLALFTGGRGALDEATCEVLQAHRWPGNVRELRNAIERAALLSQNGLVLPDHLPARVRRGGGAAPVIVPLATVEGANLPRHDRVMAALHACAYNRTHTARALGISRRTLQYRLKELRSLGYQVPDFGRQPLRPVPGYACAVV